MLTLVEYEDLLKLAKECANELMERRARGEPLEPVTRKYLIQVPNEEWHEFISQVELNIHRKEYPQI